MWAYLHTADHCDSALFQLSGPWKFLGEFSLCGRTYMQRVSVITRGRVTLLLLDRRNLADNFTASADTPRTSQLLHLRVTCFPMLRNRSASGLQRGGTNERKFGLEDITTSFQSSFLMACIVICAPSRIEWSRRSEGQNAQSKCH